MSEILGAIGKCNIGREVWPKSRAGGQVSNALACRLPALSTAGVLGWESAL